MEGLTVSFWGRFKMQMSKAGFGALVLRAVVVVVLMSPYWTLLSLKESFWGRFMMQKSWAEFDVEWLVQIFLGVGWIFHWMLSFLVISCWRRFKMQMSWAGLEENGLAQIFLVVVGPLHFIIGFFVASCWVQSNKMQTSRAGFDHVVVLGRIIIIFGQAFSFLSSWIVFATRLSRWRRLKAQASFRGNDEELVAQQVLSQRDGRSGSSEDSLPITATSENEVTVTSENEVILPRDAEDMDVALGSPDKSQWTAHSPFASSNDETSETEKRDREAQLQKAMLERLVRDDWPVYSRERVHFGKKIAEGGQAEIYAASLKSPNEDIPVAVAVKKFKIINGISEGHNPPELKSRQSILNVCRPIGVFFNDGQLCLIMPRLDGDLRAVIDRQMELHSAPPFPKPVALHIIMQLAMGLKSLHEVGIYHRDLKAANILVEEMKVTFDSYKVYISDFESSEDVIGTLFYRAPEVLRQVQAQMEGHGHERAHLREHEWAAADVYSFGMVCYEILTGEVPKIGDMWSDYSMALCGLRPELPPAIVPDGLRLMIERCWHEDPQTRPTPSEIFRHIKGINNDGVYIPAPVNVGMEILVDVLGYIFQPVSFLLQLLVPTERVLDSFLYHILLILRILGLSEESSSADTWIDRSEGSRAEVWRDWMYLRKWKRLLELHMKFHAALMHQNQFALTDGLHIDEKNALLRDFVEAQFAARVWMPSVLIESEVIIRQMSDTKHRWALRRHLSFLCVMRLLESEVAYIVLYGGFVFKWLHMELILAFLFSTGNTFFWYRDMSLAIGIGLFLMPYIRALRAHPHPHLYCRTLPLLCILSFFVGNGERFKYWCLLDLASTVGRNYGAYKQACGETFQSEGDRSD